MKLWVRIIRQGDQKACSAVGLSACTGVASFSSSFLESVSASQVLRFRASVVDPCRAFLLL